MTIFLSVLHIIFTVSLIILILLQSAKSSGLSGSIMGGSETFFGKNSGRTMDAIFSKYTTVAAIGFLITSIFLYASIAHLPWVPWL